MNDYRGRFAPTPSGPLHFGSLFAAVVSYLDAKAHNGTWLVRIDDLDPPREQAGAADAILKTLEAHGLEWDEPVVYQSQQNARYQQRLDELTTAKRIFWCSCSRKQLTGLPIYPGHCRQQQQHKANCAARFWVQTQQDSFNDLFQGEQSANIKQQYGDVVLKRRDALFAYQLAVVSDDIDQNISHIIRGIDLMDSSFWQRELYRAFNQTAPIYGHFAVLHAQGSSQKLSKQNLAPAVNDHAVKANLQAVFQLLGMDIEADTNKRMLSQAINLWRRQSLTQIQTIPAPDF